MVTNKRPLELARRRTCIEMLKFPRTTGEDRRIAASIERRRQIEEERKKRIFNPRFRNIGIDKEFLDRQVEEKRQQREEERAKECQLDESLVRSSKIALQLEKEQAEEKRRINEEIEAFRRLHQRREDRRDYDLYDPDALKTSLPCRVSDDDPRLGLASAQKFEGEDYNFREQDRMKKEEMRWWVEKQRKEREMAEKERKDAEKAYQEAVVSRDKRAVELEKLERECRRRLTEANASFNRAMAEEQEHRRLCEAAQDEEDKKAEIYNHVTGDFLTEAPEQAESNRGPKKPLASRYKGMTADQLKVFRDEQARQMEEIQKMKLDEKRINVEWDRLMNAHAQTAEAYQRELDRKKTELNKKIAEENLRLAEQQKSYQEYLNRVVYKNKPSLEYFLQFNKGTR
ncbi:RIB43A-like with coiled-coils protein 2 isoform X1 [Vespa crabro]|uniref:RIB43A-like with coiled-coils protein 2 isoform X1 n=2 Tax=Vespa crabro TaxID=7445 RepID=UPI001F00B369|nr:RIB43A-like with coiled-coils protein 2 isoform X1 [Vespa crabro]